MRKWAWVWLLAAAGIFAFLFLGTGIYSDDYQFIMLSRDWSFTDWLKLYENSDVYFNALPMWYFYFAQYRLSGYQAVYYDLAKVVISLFALVAAWLFARQFMDSRRALLFALIFVLYPLHDATNYWYIGSYLLTTGAWAMLSHVLINRGRFGAGVATGMVGAFWSYASPPLFAGMAATFLIQKKIREFFLYISPLMLYVIYYFGVARLLGTMDYRAKDISSPLAIAKQLVMQVATFADVAIGPSFWLKIYYSILSLGWLSFIAGAGLTIFCWRLLPRRIEPVNRKLLVASGVALLSAFLILAITGRYPQIAFNLGDRVTYFGSMLLALLVVSLPSRRLAMTVLAILSFSIAGLSDHWKEWNQEQARVIENIRTNQELAVYKGEVLFVSGHQYSQLGRISHIEFFSEDFVLIPIFYHAMGNEPSYRLRTLNRRHHWESGEIRDRKYGWRMTVGDTVAVYDTERNHLIYLTGDEINAYISALPTDTRHWVQMVEIGNLRNILRFLVPHLEYVFG